MVIFFININKMEAMKPMKVVKIAFALTFVTCLMYSVNLNALPPSSETELIMDVLTRRVCYDDYWRFRMWKPDTDLSVYIKSTSNEFAIMAKGPLEAGTGLGTMFYRGQIRNQQAIILGSSGYTANDIDNGGPAFENQEREILGGEVYNTHLIMPNDCTPRYDPETPVKKQVIDAIVHSAREMLILDTRPGHQYDIHENITLCISDFNLDYPYVIILVDPLGEEMYAKIHDPSNRDDAKYIHNGDIVIDFTDNIPDNIVKKVRGNCIARTITLKQ